MLLAAGEHVDAFIDRLSAALTLAPAASRILRLALLTLGLAMITFGVSHFVFFFWFWVEPMVDFATPVPIILAGMTLVSIGWLPDWITRPVTSLPATWHSSNELLAYQACASGLIFVAHHFGSPNLALVLSALSIGMAFALYRSSLSVVMIVATGLAVFYLIYRLTMFSEGVYFVQQLRRIDWRYSVSGRLADSFLIAFGVLLLFPFVLRLRLGGKSLRDLKGIIPLPSTTAVLPVGPAAVIAVLYLGISEFFYNYRFLLVLGRQFY